MLKKPQQGLGQVFYSAEDEAKVRKDAEQNKKFRSKLKNAANDLVKRSQQEGFQAFSPYSAQDSRCRSALFGEAEKEKKSKGKGKAKEKVQSDSESETKGKSQKKTKKKTK